MGFEVRFLPEGRSWHGHGPVPLRLAAASCDILIEQPCGSRATCGRCRVLVVGDVAPAAAGEPDPDEDAAVPAMDAAVLGPAAVAEGWRLGCRLVVDRDMTVEVPTVARVVAHKSFGTEALSVVDPVSSGLGVALDVGSTTLAAAAVAMDTGGVRALASALNPQIAFGADIMSRIAFAHRREGEAELHRVLVAAVEDLVEAVLNSAGVSRQDVEAVAVVGNPTMLHSLQGLPVTSLGVAPYQGVRYEAWLGPATAFGLGLPVEAYVLPGVRGHVGADAVAGVLATGLAGTRVPRLFMDLGTNTELVLATPDGLWCTSAASGPAFEGASIRHGMRAIPGAIDQVWIAPDGRLLVRTIAGRADPSSDRADPSSDWADDAAADPVGICGSGVVDAVAELLRAGVIEPSGRMRTAGEVAVHAPGLAERIVGSGAGRGIRLTDGQRPILITAADIREIQLVKGSIGAATRLLLRAARLEVEDLEEVVLAGAFGSYVCGASARALGLIPAVDPARVRFAGNAAGAGARWALVDREARERAEGIARAARFVELAGETDYQEAFVDMLRFPDPEAAG